MITSGSPLNGHLLRKSARNKFYHREATALNKFTTPVPFKFLFLALGFTLRKIGI
jgi:hypothetical protein